MERTAVVHSAKAWAARKVPQKTKRGQRENGIYGIFIF
jgi:hypothetical protein